MINDWSDFASDKFAWEASDFGNMGQDWNSPEPFWLDLLAQLIVDVSVPILEHVQSSRSAEVDLSADERHLVREVSAQLQDLKDARLTISIAECVGGIERLSPEQWIASSTEQRSEALVDAARAVGVYLDSPVLFSVGDVQPGSMGECQPLEEGFRVSVASDLLALDHPRDAVRTLVHELRHVHQHEIVRLGELTNLDPTCVDVTTTQRWAEEFAAYSTDAYVYKNLGIEADAELFAVRVTDAIYRN